MKEDRDGEDIYPYTGFHILRKKKNKKSPKPNQNTENSKTNRKPKNPQTPLSLWRVLTSQKKETQKDLEKMKVNCWHDV